MQLTRVTDAATANDFIQANVVLNTKNAHYIRPLDKDIHDVFNVHFNKAFRHGKCERWVLTNDEGALIGRIAAFVNKKYRNKGDDVPVGGIGFFDCIYNQDAADMLFDVAKHWLLQNGMEAMDGPINFGERDRWWGLLTQGFQDPLYCMNYNQPYYIELFEKYGFRSFYDQLCFGLDPRKPFHQRFYERHAIIAADPAFKAVHIRKNDLEKFANDFVVVYNQAWAGHHGMKELKKEQVVRMFKTMKQVMDEELIWFVYHHDSPVAIFVNMPDLNQWFKYLNGKFGWWQKLRFLSLKKKKPNKKFVGVVFGVVPAFQGKGIDAFMIVEAGNVIRHKSYTEYEMQWIGDFNPRMVNIARHFGDTFRSRTLTTYRYLFDQTREFKRHPTL